MIEVNTKLPSVQFQYFVDGEMITATTEELFAGKKVVMFAVPGAFTPTCSNSHLPGYVVNYEKFAEKGVDTIICLSVNDAFVMDAWGKSQNAENIIMLADGGADFTKEIGLEAETGIFGGTRSRRYAMVVEDGMVQVLNVEEPKEFEVSDAETILAAL
ncbi:peroxiredoxin [Psychrosphaera saromensis]|uniref:Glutathione-dependent peroxiredoxin n=1 Tax=Psychrosphaera saromensis TaxID=716813 RepID=A0A2S7UU06_9GAMM|nr:peroxiredoxin [Psychrosphaera saromensis]PQJ52761.1 peroxiredoxin [Psychrosphaera saromensis]GHB71017.1 peroxiredoxin [Psychrosphaera saromensis]GLQ13251.1 peroxiredoxin [Psychrosphaera saromensis]